MLHSPVRSDIFSGTIFDLARLELKWHLHNSSRSWEWIDRTLGHILVYTDISCHIGGTPTRIAISIVKNEFGLTNRPTKVQIAVQKVTFLGHNVRSWCIEPEGTLVNKILKIPVPKTTTTTKFGDCWGYWICTCIELTTGLCELIRKSVANNIIWTAKHDVAVWQVQSLINKAPILCLPDLTKPFFTVTDVSMSSAVGCVIQKHQGMQYQVAYASRKLSAIEHSYPSNQKDRLAVIWSCQRFAKYLMGAHFYITFDHKKLSFFKLTGVH